MSDDASPESPILLRNNPDNAQEYLVELSYRINFHGWDMAINLRYFPDRLLADAESLYRYIVTMTQAYPQVENLNRALLALMKNEVLPYFVQVETILTFESTSIRVVSEDRQPGWSHEGFMDRLKPL